jgi:23S rRNA pseudouridine2605 synthase
MRYRPGYVALERALSKLGAASRKQAQQLARDGGVMVNGVIVRDPLAAVSPDRDDIQVRGARAARKPWRTIAFHKPRRTVTTRRDPEGRETVFEVLGDAAEGLVAVGRLDYATSGLLLLTNDTRLAERLTNPINAVRRSYIVTVRGDVTDEACAQLEAGVEDLRAERVAVRKRSRRETVLSVDLTEGKNREIRRLFLAIGHEVTRLLRVSFGPIELGTLKPGEWREVGREELGARSKEAGGRRQEAGGRRQEAGGRRQEAKGRS